MITAAVFARYARALADVALEKGEEAAVAADLETYREIFRAVPSLVDVFHSPAVSREAKQNLLGALLARYPLSRTAANFMKVAVDQNRIRYFQEIVDLYTATVNARRGVVSAEVVSPVPLGAAELERLRASLAGATGSRVDLQVRTDPELLGGLRVRVGSTIFDGSVRRQLAEVKRRLLEA
jgi:F-type H+-transporting ATPase subunit delta